VAVSFGPTTSYESFCSNLQMSEQRDSGLSREGAPREGRRLSPFLGTINVEARPAIPTKLSSGGGSEFNMGIDDQRSRFTIVTTQRGSFRDNPL